MFSYLGEIPAFLSLYCHEDTLGEVNSSCLIPLTLASLRACACRVDLVGGGGGGEGAVAPIFPCIFRKFL